ncbi:MAG: NUDIX domain-containing protein [Firmicutes bacterium]|nr:NUDIX domain-containing protein [Bacillota bacterium]
MEQFDILDKNGNPTGLTAVKGSALKPGQYYHGVHVYVFNRALEFLVQQRSYDKNFLPGGWDVVLEHTMAGETSIECAIRGLKEEIGLVAIEADMRFVHRFIWEEYNHMVDVYFLQLDFNLSKLALEEGKVIGAKTITKTEMLQLVKSMYYRPEEYRQFIMNEINKI